MSVNTVNSDGSLSRVAGGTLYADSPIGTISPFGGSVIPSGYLLCNGAEVLKTAYAELYAVIGNSFGTASDNTKFKLPDLREATTKGVGLNGKSSVHYDTDGVALGEFIEDRMQDHLHRTKLYNMNFQVGGENIAPVTENGGSGVGVVGDIVVGRHGATNEVKAVGVNYIIKAKQVAVPADFKDAIDDALSEFAKPISLVSLNNSSIAFDKSRIAGGIVTVCASIFVPSGNYLVKENAVANIPNYGTGSIGYILPCLYRNIRSGAEEPGYAIIQTDGNLYPYYTKTEYNEIRINASYSSKI